MEPEKHRDITKQMAERLREQRLPYREGAWEDFEALGGMKSRHVVLWPYFSGAAALLIMGMVFLWRNDWQVKSTTLVQLPLQEKNLIIEKDTLESVIPMISSIDSGMEEHEYANIQRKELVTTHYEDNIEGSSGDVENENPVMDQNKNESMVSPPQQLENKEVTRKQEDTSVSSSTIPPKIEERLARQTNPLTDPNPLADQGNGIESQTNKKWNVGIEVSPTFSNNQVNLGGGLALAYSLSSKLSISSGISYVQLDAQRGPSMGGAMQSAPASINLDRPTTTNRKTLNSINSHLVGLDIPINLNYHLNKRIYVSAGVSVFNVLQEDRVNEFKSQVAETAYTNKGIKNPEPIIRTFYSEEAVQEKPYEKDNFAGFLNFSVGYAIPFSRTIGVSVAPFFKLPVGNLTEQDMDLTNGGVKIIASF